MEFLFESILGIEPGEDVVFWILGITVLVLAIQLVLLCRYLDKKPKAKHSSVPIVVFTLIVVLSFMLTTSIRESLFFTENATTLAQIHVILSFAVSVYIGVLLLAFVLRFIMLRTRAHHKHRRKRARKGGTDQC